MAAVAVAAAGCAATPEASRPAPVDLDAETLPVERGADGSPATWAQLMDAVGQADVVLLGEQHDDAVGHAAQRAIVEQTLERWPGTAVSMEMLDRSEQAAVDDYLAGYIELERFLERTAATRWRTISLEYLNGEITKAEFSRRIGRLGWSGWLAWYQPIVDAAREAGAPVVAANTPWLIYTSVARREGFEALETLTPAQQALFEIPAALPTGRYRERFWQVIAGRAEGETPEPPPADDPAGAHGMSLSDEQVLGMLRGQSIMDATMAASIAGALDAGASKVVHLVGRFHSDYDGGLVQELRSRLPDATILVVSMPAGSDDGDDEPGRADFIIRTTGALDAM